MFAMAKATFSVLVLLVVQAFAVSAVLADDWKPVDPADLAVKQPKVEKDADAEAIFWDVSVADELDNGSVHTILKHYIRIKIFTDRGRETNAKIDIPFANSVTIDDISGRTIKPDGSIVELKKEDIFERTVVKVGGLKIKMKSFAMPAVTPGSIIEYRYRENRNEGEYLRYQRLKFQRDIPVELVKYHIRPLSSDFTDAGMRSQTFHGQNTPFVKENDGFYTTTMTNVPAYHEEPHMPPEYEVQPWMLVFYTEDSKLDAQKFWTKYGKDTFERTKSFLKVNDDVRRASAEAVGDATAPEEKLKRIYAYCQKHIKNASFKGAGATGEQREKMKENKSPADTLKRGIGDASDIDMAFAAMATAAGFDARFASVPDRSDVFFDQHFPDSYFIRSYDIAVKVGNSWRFYDPGTYYLPFGMLTWREEGVMALVSDSKNPEFVKTPMTPPDGSIERRTGRFSLGADGVLEGDVKIEYGGQLATSQRIDSAEESPTEMEKDLKDAIKGRIGNAEVSDVKMAGFDDTSKPIICAYHIKVPGYAVRTGKRLFLQPGFFEQGAAAAFPTNDRKYPIYFHYPWSESDDIQIALPEGYELDHADAPGPVNAGQTATYNVTIGITHDKKTLTYKRNFGFGGGEAIYFPTTTYPQLKKLFDYIHESDGHTITLKLAESAAASN
ncbi:MAG TPA: DUF3857 domain-containing protein [Blastocatellia bacterium]|nr:DUF3857 domain-containing protein [Blastocatellia bacterium]